MSNEHQNPESSPHAGAQGTGAFSSDQGQEMPFGLGEAEGASGTAGRGTPLTDNERLLAGLSYASQILIPVLLPVILLISEETKHSRFLRYHAIQSLGLLVASILYDLAATIVYVVGSATVGCLGCVLWALFLVPAGVLLYYGWQAYQGEYAEIPWLTPFLKTNGWL